MAKKKKGRTKAGRGRAGKILDEARQLGQPAEFRIPALSSDQDEGPAADARSGPPPSAPPPAAPADGTGSAELRADLRLLAEAATFLWFMKTKHFGKAWGDIDVDLDDAKDRRALGRLLKCADSLAAKGVEVHDPTGERYPIGAAKTMKPIQITPTAGISHEIVTQTVTPIVYIRGRLIQQSEVFVASPMAEGPHPPHENASVDETVVDPTETAEEN